MTKIKKCIKLLCYTVILSFILKSSEFDSKNVVVSNDPKKITVNEEEIINKIFVNLEEQGFSLTKEATDAIINNNSLNSRCLLKLDENLVLKSYENIYNLNTVENHLNDYYDEENAEFEVTKLINIISKNSETTAKYTSYEALTKDEIEYILKKFIYEYLPKYDEIYKLDKEQIACNLANLRMLYEAGNDKYSAYVYVDIDIEDKFKKNTFLVYCDSHENIYEFDIDDEISFHELFHVLCKTCSCNYQKQNDFYVFTNGLGINYIKDQQCNKDLEYCFIQEANAEKNLQNFSLPQTAYKENIYILDNITMALSLNPNKNLDAIFKQNIENDPINFIRNFMQNPTDDLTYFYNIITFLNCYDFLLSDTKDYSKLPLNVDTYFQNLIDYAQNELTKIFFNNLIIYNDTVLYDENLNQYLIKIFYERMIEAEKILRNYNLMPNADFSNYNTNFNILLNNFYQYLETKNISYNKNYNLENSLEYPKYQDYLSFEKYNFYQKMEKSLIKK